MLMITNGLTLILMVGKEIRPVHDWAILIWLDGCCWLLGRLRKTHRDKAATLILFGLCGGFVVNSYSRLGLLFLLPCGLGIVKDGWVVIFGLVNLDISLVTVGCQILGNGCVLYVFAQIREKSHNKTGTIVTIVTIFHAKTFRYIPNQVTDVGILDIHSLLPFPVTALGRVVSVIHPVLNLYP